jgi:hypothetical protein
MDSAPPPPTPEGDVALLESLAAALRDERRRAPADLLALLTILLVVGAAMLLLVGLAVGDGVGRDVLLNLTGEFVGAALTVVLIGGLWERFRATSFDTFDALQRVADRPRSGATLTDEERAAFAAIVDIHERTAHSSPPVRLVRATLFTFSHRRQLRILEEVLRPQT